MRMRMTMNILRSSRGMRSSRVVSASRAVSSSARPAEKRIICALQYVRYSMYAIACACVYDIACTL